MSDLRNKMAKQLRDAQHRGLYGQALSVEAARASAQVPLRLYLERSSDHVGNSGS